MATRQLSGPRPRMARQTPAPAPRPGANARAGARLRLKLYVAGQTPKSIRAFSNLKRFCEKYMPGRYDIEVVDLLEKPQLAHGDQIVAIPTLVKKLPLPMRKIIGDLSDETRMLVGLDLQEV